MLYKMNSCNGQKRLNTQGSVTSLSAAAIALSLIAGLAAVPDTANAETTFLSKFIGSQTGNGNDRSAEAVFSFDDLTNDLIITLTNTHDAAADTIVPTDILTGLFFTLDPVNPLLNGDGTVFTGEGSIIVNDPDYEGSLGPDGLNVSGEWAFKSGNILGSRYGISSTGLNIFGPHDRFDTSADLNLWDNLNVGGMSGGLIGLNYNDGNGGVDGNEFIKNSIKITMTASPLRNWLATDFTNVQFQYGTSQSSPRFGGVEVTVVPEPGEWATYLIMGGSLGMVVLRARKRRKGAMAISA